MVHRRESSSSQVSVQKQDANLVHPSSYVGHQRVVEEHHQIDQTNVLNNCGGH